MRRFNYALVIVTLLTLAAMPAVAQSIIVSNDEYVFADGYLNLAGTNDAQFADNATQWMTGGPCAGCKVLILDTNSIGLTYNSLATLLSGPPFNFTVDGPTTTVPTLATLLSYKAIFLSSCDATPAVCPGLDFSQSNIPNYPALDAALVQYISQAGNPGNVFILAGTTCHDGRLWNGFLNTFGLKLADSCNNISNIIPVGPFASQPPYGSALFGSVPPVNNLYIQNGSNVSALGTLDGVQIFNFTCTPSLCAFVPTVINGLYGAWRRPSCTSTNILLNGDFETGDFTGWTSGGNFEDTEVTAGQFYDYSGAENGSYYAVLGPVGSDGTLSQTFVTTPGAPYTFCFWLNAVGDNPSDFTATWDGNPVYRQNEPNTLNVWTLYAFSKTGTGTDTITFSFRDDPAYIALDNVSVGP